MISFTAIFALLCAANVILARDALDCIETAKRYGSINFISALSESGLTEAVRALKTSTIFVPTNAAFLSLPERFRQQYRNDSKVFQQTILNHVISGTTILYANLMDEKEYPTLATNATIRANVYNSTVTDYFKTINGARINDKNRDIPCGTEVVLHFVDQLITSISTVDLLTTIKNNASFSSFLKIYGGASKAGKQLLTQAEGETVFIPDDLAFGKLPSGTVDSIANDTKRSDDCIATHVVDSNVYFSQSLWDKRILPNHRKENLVISYDKAQNKLTVNAASFVDVDIAATNGVYHIIDTVLYKINSAKLNAAVDVL